MNKKGIIIPVVTVFGVVVLLYAAFAVYTTSNDPPTGHLGNLQYEIIKLQQQGEQRLFYLDQLAKYAGYNTVKRLTSSAEPWDFDENNPKLNYENNFKKIYEEEFKKLTENVYFDIPDDYEFEINVDDDKTTVTGITDSRLKLEKIEDYKIFYEVDADFKQEIKFGTKDYGRLLNLMSNEAFISCLRAADDQNSLNLQSSKPAIDCKEHVGVDMSADFDWNINKRSGVVSVRATSKEALPLVGNVVYMFAIDLNKTPFLKITSNNLFA